MLVIGLIIIVLFGAKRIPQMMKGLGEGMKEFKKATKEDDTKEDDEKKDK
ncbi:MAG: twin-arginine translocase TatA/TatE family subunit [Bacteroidetes bacterium]|nr:twin-arginine translocase TatA/TatE family subunit [Bacteroidota bacterium]